MFTSAFERDVHLADAPIAAIDGHQFATDDVFTVHNFYGRNVILANVVDDEVNGKRLPTLLRGDGTVATLR